LSTFERDTLRPRLVKTKEAAAYIAVSPWKLRRLAQDGIIPFVVDDGGTSPWRWDVRDLDAYIDRSKQRSV